MLLDATRSRLKELGIALEVSEEALSRLIRDNTDPAHGARPLRRAITERIEDPAADLLLSGALTRGQTLYVDLAQGEFALTAR